MTEYGYSVEVAEGYDEAVVRARMALRAEGFGILSEMHVGGLLGPEAGTERQYLIMGLWNAALSQRQIAPDLRAAVHLPCNLVVQETGPTALVAALDPEEAMDPAIATSEELTRAAKEALGRVLQKVTTPSA